MNNQGEFKDIIINSVLIGLVTICLFSFSIGLINLNGADPSDLNTPAFNFTGLNKTLSELQTTAENEKAAFQNENPLQSPLLNFGSIVYNSIVGAIKVFFEIPVKIAGFLLGGIANVFGVPPLVMGVLLAILIILIILGAYSLHRIGR